MRILSEHKIVITREMMWNRTHREMPHPTRSPGVHVQAVNKKLGIAAGKLSDSDDASFPFERMTDTTYPLMMALGESWEEFCASLYTEDELIWQPGEVERDGIFGSPDGYLIAPEKPLVGGSYEASYDPYQPRTWECKRTTKKLQSVSECWMYLKQGLSYFAMGAPARVQYDVLWVCGDYSRPYQPVATSTVVEFEQREAEAWWEVVKRTAEGMEAE